MDYRADAQKLSVAITDANTNMIFPLHSVFIFYSIYITLGHREVKLTHVIFLEELFLIVRL